MNLLKCFFVQSILLCTALVAVPQELTVYTYSSLTGKGSLTELLKKEWETKERKVKFVAFSTSGEMLNQVFIEKENTRADIVLGIDQLGISKAQSSGYFLKENLAKLSDNFASDILQGLAESGFLPFDYGYLAFVYDSSLVKEFATAKFSDFILKNQQAKNLILIDPRTSQLGMSFLAWTKMIWKEAEWEKNMRLLIRSTKVWAPGWSAAYSLFQKGEGEYVLSYTTSPAYHIEEEKKEQYKTLTFRDGHFQQIETAAITKTTKKVQLAKDFLKNLVSKHVQDSIPKLQWMYPVIKNAELLASFHKLQPVQPVSGSTFADEKTQKAWLNSWNELILSIK